jgi:hypothetical protein
MAGNTGKFVCRRAVAVGFDLGSAMARVLNASFLTGKTAPVIS